MKNWCYSLNISKWDDPFAEAVYWSRWYGSQLIDKQLYNVQNQATLSVCLRTDTSVFYCIDIILFFTIITIHQNAVCWTVVSNWIFLLLLVSKWMSVDSLFCASIESFGNVTYDWIVCPCVSLMIPCSYCFKLTLTTFVFDTGKDPWLMSKIPNKQHSLRNS